MRQQAVNSLGSTLKLGFCPAGWIYFILEHAGRFILLTKWVLKHGVNLQLSRWWSDGHGNSASRVIWSAHDLVDETLPTMVASSIEKAKRIYQERRSTLKSQKALWWKDRVKVTNVLKALQKNGAFILLLDDFGNRSQSSMSYLAWVTREWSENRPRFIQFIWSNKGDEFIPKGDNWFVP